MNCLSEAIGLALPGNGTIPAVHAARIRLAKHGGHADHGASEEGHQAPRHRHRSRVKNAVTVDMALGCSTNTVLHLPAIFREAGLDR